MGLYNILYSLVSTMAIGLCFVPFLFLGWKRIRKDRAYWMVGIYWLVNGLVNIPNLAVELGGTPINSALREKFLFYYNLLDTPMLLLLFYHATPSAERRRRNHLMLSIIAFVSLELGLVTWEGYDFLSSTTIIGAGLVLVLIYIISGLVQYMRKMEHTSFENSMAFIYAALLFAYGSFIIIYVFMHVRPINGISSRDSFLLYYASLFLAALLTCLGMWIYGVRKRRAYSSSSS